MRCFPGALALCVLAGLCSGAAFGAAAEPLNPRAGALVAEGQAALAAADNGKATDLFEAALAVQPGSPAIILDLAAAAQQRGMPGEALRYYRVVLAGQPQNLDALAGEGAALAMMGALDKAQRNLTQLQALCGNDCLLAHNLAQAIARGPAPRIAATTAPQPVTN